MGIFSFDRKTRDPEPGDENWPAHQEAVGALHDAFAEHDVRGLAELNDEELQRQRDARWALYFYVDELWENAKREGLEPALRPEWQGVAAVRDLAEFLASAVRERQAER